MHSLIVTTHPETGSLTHAIAQRIGDAIRAIGAGNTVTHADLVAEGFDPRFNRDDQALFRGTGPVPPMWRPSMRGWTPSIRWCWSTRCTGGRSLPC